MGGFYQLKCHKIHFLDVLDISIDIYPSYIEPTEAFQIVCTTAQNPYTTILSRNNKRCVSVCATLSDSECDQLGRTFDTNCKGQDVIVNVSPAMEDDFTTWTCSDSIGEDDGMLQRFGK